jgi:hypothetical protein
MIYLFYRLLGLDLTNLHYWIAMFLYVQIFGHPIYSPYNAKKFMGLIGSNFIGVIFGFLQNICLNICKTMSASSSQRRVR